MDFDSRRNWLVSGTLRMRNAGIDQYFKLQIDWRDETLFILVQLCGIFLPAATRDAAKRNSFDTHKNEVELEEKSREGMRDGSLGAV